MSEASPQSEESAIQTKQVLYYRRMLDADLTAIAFMAGIVTSIVLAVLLRDVPTEPWLVLGLFGSFVCTWRSLAWWRATELNRFIWRRWLWPFGAVVSIFLLLGSLLQA